MGHTKIKFDELAKKLIDDSEEKERKKIEEGLKKNQLDFSSITHLYHLITITASKFLVDYEKNRQNLENGYSNILELLSTTLNIKTDPPRDNNGVIDHVKRDPLVHSLWENRNQLNEVLSHYVIQIQNLRTLEFRKNTIKYSLIAIIVSIISAISAILTLSISIFNPNT